MMRCVLALVLLLPVSAAAQGFFDPQGLTFAPAPLAVPQAVPELQVAAAPGATLRALDRISGITTDLEMLAGETVVYRRLSVTLAECRFPPEDPTSKAYARLVIIDTTTAAEKFNGWMFSDSPALSAMDDARYDIWLIRCKTS